MIEPGSPFRSFVLDVYRADGVADASVLLQDRCGVDVDVLLLAAFVAVHEGGSFGAGELEVARARTAQWNHDVVRPLRALRTRLKDGPSPAPNAATATLRDRIKALELDAEMIEIDELSDLLAELDAPAAPGDAEQRASAAISTVVRIYA